VGRWSNSATHHSITPLLQSTSYRKGQNEGQSRSIKVNQGQSRLIKVNKDKKNGILLGDGVKIAQFGIPPPQPFP
jgi:hypothetical protein